MGRLLGILASDVTPFGRWLFSAPRSMDFAAGATPEGWGAAVYDRHSAGWTVERRSFGAHPIAEEAFAVMAPRMRGHVLVAHLRARADAVSAVVTTQPLQRGGWVLAHDGVVDNIDFLRRSISPRRLREGADSTSGQLLFAFLLTLIDAAGEHDVDAAVRAAANALANHRVGATSFLLSDGASLYAHRHGPPLHLAPDLDDTHVTMVASEPLTDTSWLALEEGAVVRCGPAAVVFLEGTDPRKVSRKSDVELPFTD